MIEYRGPVKDRSCTDVFCLIIFIAFLVGWGIVGYFGMIVFLFLNSYTISTDCAPTKLATSGDETGLNVTDSVWSRSRRLMFPFRDAALTLGDPQRIIHPTDSQGRMCGLHESVRDKPYLFFFDLAKCANPSVLTYGCPTPQVSDSTRKNVLHRPFETEKWAFYFRCAWQIARARTSWP